jgi:hypothetical protein
MNTRYATTELSAENSKDVVLIEDDLTVPEDGVRVPLIDRLHEYEYLRKEDGPFKTLLNKFETFVKERENQQKCVGEIV